MASHEIAKIDANAACLTLINVFEVEPEKRADLVRLLSEATETVIRRQPAPSRSASTAAWMASGW